MCIWYNFLRKNAYDPVVSVIKLSCLPLHMLSKMYFKSLVFIPNLDDRIDNEFT